MEWEVICCVPTLNLSLTSVSETSPAFQWGLVLPPTRTSVAPGQLHFGGAPEADSCTSMTRKNIGIDLDKTLVRCLVYHREASSQVENKMLEQRCSCFGTTVFQSLAIPLQPYHRAQHLDACTKHHGTALPMPEAMLCEPEKLSHNETQCKGEQIQGLQVLLSSSL